MAVIHGQYSTTGLSKSWQVGVHETDWIQLVADSHQVDQNDYGTHVAVDMPGSGELLTFSFRTLETGTGAVQTPAGKLLVFNAPVTITAGDTSITAIERAHCIAMVQVLAGDWQSDANGASASIKDQPVAYNAPDVSNSQRQLYVAWFHEDATSFNDGAGDDEELYCNIMYRMDHRE